MGTIQTAEAVSHLLFGKTRFSILALLYARNSESFYLREISRSVGGGLGAVQRAVGQLFAAGLIRRTVRGRQVFYQAEIHLPLYLDLNSLVAKTTGIHALLRAALRPLASRINLCFIYGSFARQEDRPGSDVDLMVVGDASFREVSDCLAAPQKTIARDINPTVMSLSEWNRKRAHANHFLTRVLVDKKLYVLGDESELAKLAGKRLARSASKQQRRNSRPARNRNSRS